MTYSLSYEELTALRPCGDRRTLFTGAERLTAREALQRGASISDLLWVADRLGLNRECVQFGLACAERVAHLNTYPRVQRALATAQAKLDTANAANAAYAAAYAAANAAYAAANAAYAADDAYAVEREEQKKLFLEIFNQST